MRYLILLLFSTSLFAQTFSGTHSGTKIDSAVSGIYATAVYADTLFADNAVHLFHYFGDSTVTFSFAVIGTWYHLTNAGQSLYTQAENDGFTVSNDTITVLKGGDYDLQAKLSIIGTNQKTSAVRFFNITKTAGIPVAGSTTALGDPDVVGINVSAYGEFDAGDKVILQIKQDATSDIVLKNGIIKMYLVHL